MSSKIYLKLNYIFDFHRFVNKLNFVQNFNFKSFLPKLPIKVYHNVSSKSSWKLFLESHSINVAIAIATFGYIYDKNQWFFCFSMIVW
jgi:hypothetical protein